MERQEQKVMAEATLLYGSEHWTLYVNNTEAKLSEKN
jgi:hypothetical protein